MERVEKGRETQSSRAGVRLRVLLHVLSAVLSQLCWVTRCQNVGLSGRRDAVS